MEHKKELSKIRRFLNQITTDSRLIYYLTIGVLAVLLTIQVIQNRTILQRDFSPDITVSPFQVGNQIKSVTLKAIDGQELTLNQLNGNYKLLIFFHTQCEFCERDLSLWQKMHEQAAERNIDIVAITMETNIKAVEEYAQSNNLLFPVLIDSNQELFSQLLVSGTPTKVLLSNDLRVVQIWRGWTTQYSHESDLGSMFAILGIEPQDIPLPPDLPSRTLNPLE